MSDRTVNFRSRVLTSAKLSGLRFSSDVLLRLISTILLTRLLAPEIYGVFAVVLVYLYLLEVFSDFGIRSLILTKEGEIEDDFLRTCWTLSVIRGGLILLFSCVIGGIIAALQDQGLFAVDSPYANEVLPWAIAALGGASFIAGFSSPMRFVQEREMKFGRFTVVHIAINVIGLITTVALAFYLRSVWALVLGGITKSIALACLSFAVFPGPAMRLKLHPDYLRLAIDRGKWIITHSMMNGISQSADRLMLGFVMNSSMFGFYFIARQLVDIVTRFLESIDGTMGLQVFTHIQTSDAATFRAKYYRYRFFFDAVAGCLVGWLVMTLPLLVGIVFDDRYGDVSEIAQTLIWAAMLVGPLLLRSAFSAERRFREMTLLSLISTVTLWGGLVLSIFVLDSIYYALIVIALHRLPEAMVLTIKGGDRDWVIFGREFISFGFCGIGIGLGMITLWLWEILI